MVIKYVLFIIGVLIIIPVTGVFEQIREALDKRMKLALPLKAEEKVLLNQSRLLSFYIIDMYGTQCGKKCLCEVPKVCTSCQKGDMAACTKLTQMLRDHGQPPDMILMSTTLSNYVAGYTKFTKAKNKCLFNCSLPACKGVMEVFEQFDAKYVPVIKNILTQK